MHESSDSIENCFVYNIEFDSLRFTKKGKEKYRSDLAKIGVNIDNIKTISGFIKYNDILFMNNMNRLLLDDETHPLIKNIINEHIVKVVEGTQ